MRWITINLSHITGDVPYRRIQLLRSLGKSKEVRFDVFRAATTGKHLFDGAKMGISSTSLRKQT